MTILKPDCVQMLKMNNKEAVNWLKKNIYFCSLCPLHDNKDFFGCRHCQHLNIKQRYKCLFEIKKYIKAHKD